MIAPQSRLIRVGVLTLLFLNACLENSTSLSITDAWARPAAAGNNGAVYLVLENASGELDAIVAASSDAARVAEIHESMLMGGDDLEGMVEDGNNENMQMEGVMQMLPRDRVELISGQIVVFEPGGLHIMLIDLERDLKVGDSFQVTLIFERAGEYVIDVNVVER